MSLTISLPKGQISVALADLGSRKRLIPVPKSFNDQIQELSYRFGTEVTKEFVPDKETKAKLIIKGHTNVQNYVDMKYAEKIKAGRSYDLEFELQSTFYRLLVGVRLGSIVYSADQGMTKRLLEDETYTIDLDKTQLTFHEM